MSKIQWTDATWNPIIGCSHAGSPACDNCYAQTMAARLANIPATWEAYSGLTTDGKWNGTLKLVESALGKPLHWRKPKRVFVGSMTDLFHPKVPDEWLDKVFAVIALTPHITYQILTKRPERMREYLSSEEKCMRQWGALATRVVGCRAEAAGRKPSWPLPNVWLGVTAEDQQRAGERIPILLDTPAAKRFVSIEPMLGPVDLERYVISCAGCGNEGSTGIRLNRPGSGHDLCLACIKGEEGTSLDWVICGGESGPNARPMHPDWPRGLRDQCKAADVPFFFKQWGEWSPDSSGACLQSCLMDTDGEIRPRLDPEVCESDYGENGLWGWEIMTRVGKARSGHLLDGVEHREFSEVQP